MNTNVVAEGLTTPEVAVNPNIIYIPFGILLVILFCLFCLHWYFQKNQHKQ
jgi:predicted cation transporter